MDSLDLLAREDEFKKLNKQLEKKTESLMKEIEKAMQKQDIFSEFSHSLTLSPTHAYSNIKKHCCDTPKISTPERTPIKTSNGLKTSAKLKNNSRNISENKSNNECAKDCNCCANIHTKDCVKDAKCTHNCAKDANCIQNCVKDAKCAHNCAKDAKCAQNCANECTGDAENAQNCANDCKTDVSDKNNCEVEIRNGCSCFSLSRRERIDGDLGFLYAFVAVSVEEGILPKSFLKDRATVESVCKFLSSKIKLMQDQINQLQATLDRKATQCEAHLSNLSDLEGERLSLTNTMNNLTAASAHMKAKLMTVQRKLEEKQKLYEEQRSETDKLNSEVKRLRSKNASVEARCASQEVTIDNLKHQTELAKTAERELRESARALSTSHTHTVKELQRRISALNSRIAKQEALIDNLRRQRALLTADGAVSNLEKEYSDFLMDL